MKLEVVLKINHMIDLTHVQRRVQPITRGVSSFGLLRETDGEENGADGRQVSKGFNSTEFVEPVVACLAF